MKKIALFSAIFFFSFSLLSAQKFVKKWIIVRDTESSIVYIDTSSIKMSEGQLSLWSLVRYKKPKEFVMYQGKVSKVKSHILFDTAQNRYTVIGALFYDKRARIIGESSTPTFSRNQRIISSNIIPDSDQEIMLEKAKEYIATGKIVREVPENIMDEVPKKYIFKKDSEPEPAVKDTIINPFGDVPFEPVLTEDSTLIKNSIGSKLRDELTTSEEEDSIVTMPKLREPEKIISFSDSMNIAIGKHLQNELEKSRNSSTSKYLSLKSSVPKIDDYESNSNLSDVKTEKEDNSKSDIENKNGLDETNKEDNTSYNTDIEEQVSKNIWSDGNLFVIQLSSWRSRSKAGGLVKKLKSQGNNAFVFEKYIQKKKRNYYRVRVGFFSTLAEAKRHRKNLK